MRRPAVAALLVLGMGLPACAQRGAARGGGASFHSAPAFHSAPTAPMRSSVAPAYSGLRAPAAAPAYRTSRPGYPGSRVPPGRYRRPIYSVYPAVVPYSYILPPWSDTLEPDTWTDT